MLIIEKVRNHRTLVIKLHSYLCPKIRNYHTMASSSFKYKTVIMRGLADSLAEEAVRPDDEVVVDMTKARLQMDQYRSIFREKLGLNVIQLPADESLPDCVFVEDPAIVIGDTALLTTPGHESRRDETKEMEKALRSIEGLKVVRMSDIDGGATMDGGDVMFTGEELFVGQGKRTNTAALRVAQQVFPHVKVTPIAVPPGILHLKSACSFGGAGTILCSTHSAATRNVMSILKESASGKYNFVEIRGHPRYSNCIYLETQDRSVLIYQPPENEHIKKDFEALSAKEKIAVDMSEMKKVDGCLTCCSLLLSL